MTEKNNQKNHKVAIGLAAGLVAAAAAGAYFVYGSKNSKKYKSTIKSWMFKAKGEILSELEKLENVTEDQYHSIVDSIIKKYETISSINKSDVDTFVKDIKKQWSLITKSKKRATRKK